jgi:hypothetical protein
VTQRHRIVGGLLLALGLVVSLFLWWRPFGGAPSEPVAPRLSLVTAAPPRSAAPRRGGVESLPEGSSEVPSPPAVEVWAQRLARAQQTLSSYLAATRYPPGSRSMAEHPDQARPHYVAPLALPLARRDGKLTNAKVTLRQDRMFLVGDERAALGIACDDGDGPATCAISSAAAIVPPDVKDASSHRAVPITFSEGEGGGLATVFQPSTQGFGGYRGPIRIEITLTIGGEAGGASFDVVYSPSAPASFTGRVDEALRDGSLDLDVEIEVDEPGRYVIAARVDDADGRSFAYLSENEELHAGRQAARLRVFGKLIRDEGAVSPFRLRDLEGFRLLEDAYPDRAPMSAREGVVHTTKRYALRDFADAEWESEERSRHVKELTKDVDEARQRAEGGR